MTAPSLGAFFSPDYVTARERFRDAARAGDRQLLTYALDAKAPDGQALTIDVALSAGRDARNALLLSSGLHGVEGFFGSAVQLALLEEWRQRPESAPAARCILVHALNPYGFACSRRVNEDNVDLNRNLLLDGDRYEGCPADYRALDGLLNPRRPPSAFEPFLLKSLFAIARYGVPALKQAIASGQYEYPRGLFYGGSRPAASSRLLAAHFDEWLGACERVIHLDFHTGLGRFATYKLLIDYPIDAPKRERLADWFGRESFEVSDTSGVAYTAPGNFGRWCWAHAGARDYTYTAAEFGTHGERRMLAGLRAENQAHHWGDPDATSTRCAKKHLVDLFCPRSPRWRAAVLNEALQLVERAAGALAS